MHEVTYQIDPITIAGITNKQQGKPIILALHGWLDNANSFVPLLPFLNEFHVIALDWAGHGHSEHRPAGMDYLQMDYVDDLHQLIERNDWRDVTLLGHSMGGIIASIYAAVYPEKISKVISIDSFGPLVSAEADTVETLRIGIDSRQKQRKRADRAPTEVSLQQLVEKRRQLSELSKQNVELLIQRSVRPLSSFETSIQADTLVEWTTDKRLRQPSLVRLTEGQAKIIMSQIDSKMLVIAASEGFIMKREQLEQRRDWNKLIKVTKVEGGHHVHMQEPESVGQLIAEFLAT